MKKCFNVLLLITLFFISPFVISAKTITPEELIEHTKESQYYDFITASDGSKWDLTYDKTSKKIRSDFYFKADDGKETNVDFYISYNEDEKYLEYIANNSKDVAISENIYLGFIINSLGEMFEYSSSDIKELINSEDIDEYTLDAEGIYMEYEELIDYQLSDSSKWNGKLIKKLQISLDDGFGNLEAKPNSGTVTPGENVSNPKTADANIYLIILGIVSSISLIVVSKNKLSLK